MRKITESNLKSAFSGESQAHIRYLIYGEKAEKEGLLRTALLFRAIAFAEQVHATNHFRVLRNAVGDSIAVAVAPYGLSSSSENIQLCIDGENFEISEMYPTYIEVAKQQGEKAAEQTFTWAWQVEKIHAELFSKAKESVDAKKDIEITTVHICGVCGYTVEGEAPDICPVCRAKRERFRKFE